MAKYSYLPPPKLPIQLTRTQMLRDRARKQLGSPKVPRRVYATAPVVRRNIKSMLTEEMERRAGEWTRGEPEIEEVRWQPQREEEDAAATRRQSCASPQYTVATERKQQRQSQDHDHEDEPQPRMSPPRPSPSTMRELDDLLALPSRLTAAVFSPPRGFAASPPAHRHIDPASFAEMPRTVPRARRDGDLVQWKDDLAREMIEQRSLPGKTQGNDAERPLAHSTSTLLTPFTSDADIDAHLKQLFSGGGQLHVPPPVSEAGSSSHRAATAAIDSPGYSSSFVSSVASSVRGGSDQQRDDQSRVAVLDQIDALQHLSSSAIVFQPPPPQSHSSPHMQQHLELRPVGIILGQTRST